MSVPTNATVKFANGNTGNSHIIGIILYRFHNCPIMDPVGPVYYFIDNPSNTILLGALNFFLFRRLNLNLLTIVILLNLKVVLGYQPNRL